MDACFAYFGYLAEVAEGIRPETTVPEPDILDYYHTLDRFEWRHLPWSGGLSDQPHQLMFELACVDEVMRIRERLKRVAEEQAERLRASLGG